MTAVVISLALVSLVAVAGLAASAIVNRSDLRADPFVADAPNLSHDTLHDEATVKTVFLEPKWHTATVSTLSRATDLLDSLEAHGVREREMVTLADEQFLVRWR